MVRKIFPIFFSALIFLSLIETGFPFYHSTDKLTHLTITDSLSRQLNIPKKIDRLLSLEPEITRIVVALEAEEKLVGLDYFMKHHDHLFQQISSRHSVLPVVSITSNTVNIELLMKLEPQVIFISPSEVHFPQSLQDKTGIPAVALSSMGRFVNLIREIELTGKILNKYERAQELINYFQEKVGIIRQKIDLHKKDGKKPRIYLAFWSSLNKTPVYYEPVNAAGGKNLAEGLMPQYFGSPGALVGVEKIIQWNPDIILVHGNYPPNQRTVTVESILQDTRLRSVKAVIEKKVFYTFGYWYWWDPAQVLLETYYLAKLFYPEVFNQTNLIQEGNEIYEKFYGLKNGFSSLCRILKFDEWINE